MYEFDSSPPTVGSERPIVVRELVNYFQLLDISVQNIIYDFREIFKTIYNVFIYYINISKHIMLTTLTLRVEDTIINVFIN